MNDLDLKLMAYADGELDPEQISEMEDLIEDQPALRQTVLQHRQTSALLRAACAEGYYANSTITLPPRRARSPVRQYAGWAIAATVAGMIGFGGGAFWKGQPTSARDSLVDEVAEYHEIYSRETKHLVEVAAAQSDELTAWLGRRIGRNIDVPDLTGMGLNFAGGRMLVVGGKPVAELMYTRDSGRPIALCISEGDGTTASGTSPIRLDRKGALNLASWNAGHHIFVVVGEAEQTTIHEIARQSQAHISG